MQLRVIILPVLGLGLAGALAYSYSRMKAPDRDASVGTSVTDSASARTPSRGPTAMVRFVNGMPGSPALELGHDSLMLFSNVVFGAVSPFKAVQPTHFRFTLRGPSSVGFDATKEFTLTAGQNYSILALPDTLGRMAVVVLRDDLKPDSGKARIRLIRATPGVANLVLAIVGRDAPLFEAAADSSEVRFRDVPPMTAGFRVRGGPGGETLVSLKSMALVAGTTYTFVLTSRPRGAITAITFSDASADEPTPAVARR